MKTQRANCMEIPIASLHINADMQLYTPDFVRRVGLSCLGGRRFNKGDQAQAQ